MVAVWGVVDESNTHNKHTQADALDELLDVEVGEEVKHRLQVVDDLRGIDQGGEAESRES